MKVLKNFTVPQRTTGSLDIYPSDSKSLPAH